MFRKAILFLICIVFLVSCSKQSADREVVIYVSVDQVYSEPILKDFENKTNIKVLPVYDVEASKTTGLVQRLIAEKEAPKADVFWNGEFVQTILLKDKGVLSTYDSPNSKGIPSNYIDEEKKYTSFGGRARVLLVNKKLIKTSDYPKSIFDLVDEKYDGTKIGMAYPLFGTTATHTAAIYSHLGNQKGKELFEKFKESEIQILDGNSVVRDKVVSGELIMGLTDTDDAKSVINKGQPVEMVFLDQDNKGIGTLITPNTVAIIKNSPHQEEAKIFVDYMLSEEVQQKLIERGWFDVDIRENSVQKTEFNVKGMDISLNDIYKHMEQAQKDMKEIFVR